MALFAPEVVIYCAYVQFSEARNFIRELNDIRFGEVDQLAKRTLSRDFLNPFYFLSSKFARRSTQSNYRNVERGKVSYCDALIHK